MRRHPNISIDSRDIAPIVSSMWLVGTSEIWQRKLMHWIFLKIYGNYF